MERKPGLSPFAIRKAVITTFVFGSGRYRDSSPERGTPKPCRNVSAGAGDGECGTGGKDSPVFSFAPQNAVGTDGRCRQKRRCHATWAKERFLLPQRRILHSGRPYMAWNGHGVQPASSVLTFTAGVHACFHLSDLLT